MKSVLKFLIPLLILGAVAYNFRASISGKFLPQLAILLEHLKSRITPSVACAEPLPYTLGNFDTRFNISKDYFLSALAEAETIWEKPQGDYLGKQLFVYSPKDVSANDLKINLVYDYRQQATGKLKSLGIVVSNNRASYDMLKAKFEALKISYEKSKRDYEARVIAFNKGDRTNEAEFQRLERDRQNLNNKVEEINALVVALNRLIGTLNLSVEKYNTTSVSRGESFEEGVYTSDGSKSEIDIYEFSSRDKLVRVLAHELGHALALEHVSDSKAIMYELNQGNNMALTASDLEELKTKCGTK